MYGVVEIGGSQLRVAPGDRVDVQRLPAEEGAELSFDRVLLVGGGEGGPLVGLPLVEGARVTARVVRHGRARKTVVLKKRRRGGRRAKSGHRQGYTCLEITGVEAARAAGGAARA